MAEKGFLGVPHTHIINNNLQISIQIITTQGDTAHFRAPILYK